MSEIQQVTVIGAGTMGNGIAHVFAQSGFNVKLVDVNPTQLERALQTITKNLDRQVSKSLLTEEEKQAALARLTTETDLIKGVSSAQLVVEAATENTELKLSIFRQLDELAPSNAILAT
ncbi:MAG TPA: 3-hydroxyacyl-CoA dehydrogenase NAD-binding domain-containing protein, partial [Sediminibacterium sp.]